MCEQACPWVTFPYPGFRVLNWPEGTALEGHEQRSTCGPKGSLARAQVCTRWSVHNSHRQTESARALKFPRSRRGSLQCNLVLLGVMQV
jgi:hypothetical protein